MRTTTVTTAATRVVLLAALILRLWPVASAADIAGAASSIASVVGSLLSDARSVQHKLGDTYDPYVMGNEAANQPGGNKGVIGGAIGGIVLGVDNIPGTLNQIAACDPDDKGLCCLMPNYCVSNAVCTAEKLTTNVLDLLKAVPTCTCMKGFTGDGRTQGTGCVNINECETGDALCEDICEDRAPGYACGCSAGFTLNPNGYSCDDIDECAQGSAGCTQRCENTRGSFRCACEAGYVLNSADNRTCDDVDECALMQEISRYLNPPENVRLALSPAASAALPELAICHYPELCINFAGAYGCSCPSGFAIDPNDPTKCVDIDECVVGVADPRSGEILVSPADSPAGNLCMSSSAAEESSSQQCVNLPGAFLCQCKPGYQPTARSGTVYSADLARDLLAQALDAVDDPHVSDFGRQAELYARSVVNAFALDCEDIDECAAASNPCAGAAACINLPGSYRCECATGFRYANGACEDIDECAVMKKQYETPGERGGIGEIPVACDFAAGEDCVNTDGSYACRCADGYRQVSGPENGLSVQGRDLISCEDVDECADSSLNGCVSGCINLQPGYTCTCPTGWTSGGAKGTQCVDVDECSLGFCPPDSLCLNLPGSYLCSCAKDTVPSEKLNSVEAVVKTDLRRWLLKAQDLANQVGNATDPSNFTSALTEWTRMASSGNGEVSKLSEALQQAAKCTPTGVCRLVESAVASLCPGDSVCIDYQSGFYCGCPEGYQLSTDKTAPALAGTNGSGASGGTTPAEVAGGLLGGLLGGVGGFFGRKLSATVPKVAASLLTTDEIELAVQLGLVTLDDAHSSSPALSVEPWVIRAVSWDNFLLTGGLYEDATCRDIDECQVGVRADDILRTVCPLEAPCCANRPGSWTCAARKTSFLNPAGHCPSGTLDLTSYITVS